MLDIERIYSSFIDQKQEERNENYKDFEGLDEDWEDFNEREFDKI